MNQTLPSRPATVSPILLTVPLTLFLAVGTGGHFNQAFYSSRLAGTGAPLVRTRDERAASSTTAEDLAHMRSTLKMSVQQLADCIGVSRQAVYDWKNGSSIKQPNLVKLESLKNAAATIAASEISVTPLVLARKISNGKTLLGMIAAGEDGTAAAQSLIHILQREAQQRDRLAKRFAGRSKTSGSPSDYGLPLLSERD